MKLDTAFTIIARCKVFDINDETKESYKEDLEIRFNKESAEKFLFRASPATFLVDGYKVMVKYSTSFSMQAVCLFKGNNGYIITNLNQVINDVLKGYIQVVTLDKIGTIMDFDFEAGIDIQDKDIKDEFEE